MMNTSDAVLRLLAVAMLFSVGHCSHSRRYSRVCEPSAVKNMRFICNDDSFHYPFQTPRWNLVLRSRAPDERMYPFQHRFHVCCKRGCVHVGFIKMCYYHKLHDTCSKGESMNTKRGRMLYARCLVGRTEHLMRLEGLQAPLSARSQPSPVPTPSRKLLQTRLLRTRAAQNVTAPNLVQSLRCPLKSSKRSSQVQDTSELPYAT